MPNFYNREIEAFKNAKANELEGLKSPKGKKKHSVSAYSFLIDGKACRKFTTKHFVDDDGKVWLEEIEEELQTLANDSSLDHQLAKLGVLRHLARKEGKSDLEKFLKIKNFNSA